MDSELLGQRVAYARELAGLTQDELGHDVQLDRSAISRLENGTRKLNVSELVQIAEVLRRPLSYFVAEPVPAVVSRRAAGEASDAASQRLDIELEEFASDIRVFSERGDLQNPERNLHPVPADHEAAELLASTIRVLASLDSSPIPNLAQACDELGMHTYITSLGDDGADGGCVEVQYEDGAAGATVLNGDAPHGRRRMTLAHELGHWIVGDAYDSHASISNEQMIDSFAIHFLAPRAGVTKVWNEHQSWNVRDRALAVGAKYLISWSAAVGQLRNLELISYKEHTTLSQQRPRYGDYLRLKLDWSDDFRAPYLSPSFTAAVLNSYSDGRLTAERTLELLRGTLNLDQLPDRRDDSVEALRRSFAGHDG